MLPQSVHLSGIVTDHGGKPLSEVWINHTGARIENVQVDGQGHFDIETRAPAIVFRKNGFQSKYWKVSENRNMVIALDGPAPPANQCDASAGCVSLEGFRSAFCLPRIPGVNVSKQANDADYGQRLFWIETPRGKAGIQHAAGGMWGAGLPFNEDVWSAVSYVERTSIDPQGFNIIDARGKSADGYCWRMVGHFSETASYRRVSQQDTELLDQVLDRLCIQ